MIWLNLSHEGRQLTRLSAADARARDVPEGAIMGALATACMAALNDRAADLRAQLVPGSAASLNAWGLHAQLALAPAQITPAQQAYIDRIATAEDVTSSALLAGWSAQYGAITAASLALQAALSEGLAGIQTIDTDAADAEAQLTAAHTAAVASLATAASEAQTILGEI